MQDKKVTGENSSTHKNESGKKRIALALQGGGSHGAFTWGVLDKLLEDGRFIIEGVSGTSAGGMNAVAFAHGLMKGGRDGARASLRKLWETLGNCSTTSPYMTPPLDRIVGNYNLKNSLPAWITDMIAQLLSPYQWNPLNINPLEKIVKELFDFENLRSFKETEIFLCATHVASGKLKIFNLKDICSEVMLASACLPMTFQAVRVNDEYYWDGGFVGNPAIYPLIYGCDTADILVVQLTRETCPKIPMTSEEIIERHKEITYNVSLMREMRSIAFLTDLIDKGEIKSPMKRLHMHLIRNVDVFRGIALRSALNPDPAFIEYLHFWGRKTAQKWIEDHFDDVGKRSTADIQGDFVKEE